MGATPGVLANASFTVIVLGANGAIMMLFLINGVFRGAGDAATAMRVLWFANAINIVLDPCLIFGLGPFPRLGVAGAAVATTARGGLGVAAQLWLLSRGSRHIVVRRRHVRLDPRGLLGLLRLSGRARVPRLGSTTRRLGGR